MKILYTVVAELRASSQSPQDYQYLMVELQTLQNVLTALSQIQPVQGQQANIDTIRLLVGACEAPIKESLDDVDRLKRSLDSQHAHKRTPKAIKDRLMWSTRCKSRAKILRETLAPNINALTLLLLNETIDRLAHTDIVRAGVAQEQRDNFSRQQQPLLSQQQILGSIQQSQQDSKAEQSKVTTAMASLLALSTRALDLQVANNLHLGAQDTVLRSMQTTSGTILDKLGHTQTTVDTIHRQVSATSNMVQLVWRGVTTLRPTIQAGVACVSTTAVDADARQLLVVTVQFITEMRSILIRVLRFCQALSSWLLSWEQDRLLNQRIRLGVIVLRDVLNPHQFIHFDYNLVAQDWITFQGHLQLAFKGRQGFRRVQRDQFYITSIRMGRKLEPQFWSHAIKPSDELEMTMIIEEMHAESDVCGFRTCGISTKDIATVHGGKLCPQCNRFTAISSDTSTAYSTTNQTNQNMPIASSLTDSDHLHEEDDVTEDIELYHSIRIAKRTRDDHSRHYLSTTYDGHTSDSSQRYSKARQPINEAISSAFIDSPATASAIAPEILAQLTSQVTASVIQELKARNISVPPH